MSLAIRIMIIITTITNIIMITITLRRTRSNACSRVFKNQQRSIMLSVAIFGKTMGNVYLSNLVRLLEHQEHLTQALVGDFIQVKNVACMIMVSKSIYHVYKNHTDIFIFLNRCSSI